MTISDVCLVIIALAAIAVGASAIFIATRVIPLVQRFERLAELATQTTEHLNHVLNEIRVVVRDVHQVQSRITHVAGEVLNILEPSVNTISTVVGVLRSGLSALLGIKGSRRHDKLDNPRDSGSAPTG